MEKALKAVLVGIAVLIFVGSVYGYGSGISGYSVIGCTCHSATADANTSVTMTGIPTHYTPGDKYLLNITMTSTTVPGTTGGFDLTVTSGTLTTNDPNAQILDGNATHSNNSARSWEVNWTAPAGSDTAIFYVAGLASNGGGPNGDAWNTAVYNVPVVPEFSGIMAFIALAAASTITIILARKRLPRLFNNTV